jgi:hypothetical protein
MNITQWLKVYAQQIANLDDYDDLDELELSVSLVLHTRDGFIDASLSDQEQQQLAQLDAQLRAHVAVIAKFLPRPNPPARDHWWYYLNELQPA